MVLQRSGAFWVGVKNCSGETRRGRGRGRSCIHGPYFPEQSGIGRFLGRVWPSTRLWPLRVCFCCFFMSTALSMCPPPPPLSLASPYCFYVGNMNEQLRCYVPGTRYQISESFRFVFLVIVSVSYRSRFRYRYPISNTTRVTPALLSPLLLVPCSRSVEHQL